MCVCAFSFSVFSPGPFDKNEGGKVRFMSSLTSCMICSHWLLPHKDLLLMKFLLTWYSSAAASQIYGKPLFGGVKWV